jgi:acetoin utilization deacetylase AcuC-like enzyme
LLDRDTPEPEAYVKARLAAAGAVAHVEHVQASLEDVFVAATGFRHSPLEPPPQG